MSQLTLAALIADKHADRFHILDHDGRLWLDGHVTGRGDDHVTFYVVNGDWDGRLDQDGTLTVDFTGAAFSLPALKCEVRLGAGPDQ